MQSFKKFIKGGKFLGLKEIGDSIIVRLACNPFELEPEESKFKKGVQVFNYKFEDPENGDVKTLTNGNIRFAQEIAKFEEGDLVKVMLIEAKNGQKAYAVRPAKGKTKDEDEEEDDDIDDEDDKPKKKKKVEDDEEEEDDDEESEDDEEDEDDKPKKKKSDEDDDDEEEDEDDEYDLDEDDEDKPKKKSSKDKKKKKSKK